MKRLLYWVLFLSIVLSTFTAGCAPKNESAATNVPDSIPPFTTEPPQTAEPPTTTGYIGVVYAKPENERIVPAEVKLDPNVYYITTPWHYPDTSSMTQEEKNQMVKNRNEQVAHMTTETLLDSVLLHPRLINMVNLSQISVLGYMASSGIPFLKDLLAREDLEWVMYHYPAEKLDSVEKDLTFGYIKAYIMGAKYLLDPNIPPSSYSFRW